MHSMPSGYNNFGKNKQLTTTDLMKSLLLVQWSEFRKNDLPNKYKYLPDPFWRSVARWISSSHPHLDCNTMQWPFLHGHLSWTWPCLSKKKPSHVWIPKLLTDPCKVVNSSPRCTLAIYYHRREDYPLQNLKNLKWKTYIGKNAVCCLQYWMKLLWKGCGCNWGHEIWHNPKTACILEGQIPSKIITGLNFLIPSNMGQLYDPGNMGIDETGPPLRWAFPSWFLFKWNNPKYFMSFGKL